MPQTEFKTKQRDYSKMVSVRLDDKTLILVKRGTNVKRLKQRYFERLRDSKIEAEHYKVLKSLKEE